MSSLRVNSVYLNDAGNTNISIANSWNVAISAGGQTRLQVNNDGNIGIGTTSPVSAAGFNILTLNGTTSGGLYLQNNGTNRFRAIADTAATYMYAMTSTALLFGSNDTERMRIDANGNVGIGTTAPTYKLDVFGQANVATISATRGYMNVSSLTDGSTITVDLNISNNFNVTLGGARTLSNPANASIGQSGVIFISQDSTGGRTLAFGSNWRFPGNTAPTLSTLANSVDAIAYTVRTTSSIVSQAILNVG